MDARAVAQAGYQGMQSGRGVVVPGLVNKLMAISPRLSPTNVVLAINRWLLARRS